MIVFITRKIKYTIDWSGYSRPTLLWHELVVHGNRMIVAYQSLHQNANELVSMYTLGHN